MGVMYDGDLRVEDDSEGVKWIWSAAEQGNARAQFNLGIMYANGEGVPEDYVKNYAWMNLAAAQGNEKAVTGKTRIREHMTPCKCPKPRNLPEICSSASNPQSRSRIGCSQTNLSSCRLSTRLN